MFTTKIRKLGCKALSVLLAVVMIIGLSGDSLPGFLASAFDTPRFAPSAASPEDSFTIYFQKPAGWDSPTIYFFQHGNTNMTSWPGVPMRAFRDGWYSHRVFGVSHINVVFFGGGSRQLPARWQYIRCTGETWIYADGTTTTTRPFSPDMDITVYFQKPAGWGTPNIYFYDTIGGTDNEPYPWPGIAMTALGDGWYVANESSSVNAQVLFNNSNDITQQIPEQWAPGFDVEVDVYGATWFYSDGSKASGNPRSNTSGIRVYLQRPAGWGYPSIYYYQDDRPNMDWPGRTMTDEGDGWFSYNIVSMERPQILFSSGGNQYPAQDRPGILVEGNTWFYSDFTRASANPRGNDYPIRVHFRKPAHWHTAWLYYYQDGRDSTPWPGVPMVNRGNGWFTFDITTKQLPSVIFNNQGQGQQIAGWMQPGRQLLNTESWFDGRGRVWSCEDPDPPTKTVTIHFERPHHWGEAWIWFNSDNTKPDWDTTELRRPPGDMFEYRDGWFKKDILTHDNATVQFLFNGGHWGHRLDNNGADFTADRTVWINRHGNLFFHDPARDGDPKHFYGTPGVYAPTGNFSHSVTDFTVPSVLGDLALTRTYNSFEAENSTMLGKGFHFSHDMRVINSSPVAYVIMPDSSWQRFAREGNGYRAIANRNTLERDREGRFTLTTPDRTQYRFNGDGHLVSITDRNSNTVTITRGAGHRITAITDRLGLYVSFEYHGYLLAAIRHMASEQSDEILQEVQFAYEGNRLATVTGIGGFQTRYSYHDNGLLREIAALPRPCETDVGAQPRVQVSLTYDSAGRVAAMTDGQGLETTYDYSQITSRQVTATNQTTVVTQTFDAALNITESRVAPADAPGQISERTRATFNNFHEVTESIDALGNRTRNTFDGRGNLTRVVHPDGTEEKFEYDTSNNRIRSTDKSGAVMVYTHDAWGNLLTESRLIGNRSYVMNTFTYFTDGSAPIRGLVRSETGALGDDYNRTEYTYSFTGTAKTVTSIKRVNGNAYPTVTEHDRLGRVIRTTTPTGVSTVNTYDEAGLLAKTEIRYNNQVLQTTTHEHNAHGQEVKTVEDGTITTTSEYDGETGNLTAQTAPDGTRTEYEHDVHGNVTLQTNKDSSGDTLTTTQTEYDELNRVVKETVNDVTSEEAPVTTATAHRFDSVRRLHITTTTDEFGLQTVTETNGMGQTVRKIKPGGLVKRFWYCSTSGLVQREEYQNQSGHTLRWTEYEYDDWGRVTEQRSSFNEAGSTGYARTLFTYDIAGNVLTELVRVAEDKYRKTSNTFDAWGNQTVETLYDNFFAANGTPIGEKTAFPVETVHSWDGLVLQDRGLTYEYDHLRRRVKKTDALGQVETYEYDNAGRLVRTVDRNGIVHTIEYDDAGRAVKETSGSGSNAIVKTTTYDDAGNIASITETNGGVSSTTTYRYDGMGNVIQKTYGTGADRVVKTFDETRTAAGRETLETITIGGTEKQRVRRVFNRFGQLVRVYDLLYSTTVPRARYSYDILGQLIRTDFANNTSERNRYNAAGIVTSTDNRRGTVRLSQYTYAYYYDGNQRRKVSSIGAARGQETTFVYDGRGQLVRAELAGGTVQEYTYDENRNRLKLKVTQGDDITITTYTYDAKDRLLTKSVEGQAAVTYTYDANGNMTGSQAAGSPVLHTQEFDVLNRMARYRRGNADVTYAYYTDNMRKSKTVNGMTTKHIWVSGHLWTDPQIALDIVDGDVVSYIRGHRLIRATSANSALNHGWYHYNYRGDVVQLTDDNGQVTRNYDFDPFGNHEADEDDLNPYRYTGEYYDHATGYIYLRARFYDPSIGRFINEDPALDGLNWFVYCWNDPVNFVDPSGLTILPVAGFGAFHNSYRSAVSSWASTFAPRSSGVEFGAVIYRLRVLLRTRYFMGETYRGFRTQNWYTVINGLGAGLLTSRGVRRAGNFFWPITSVRVIGFAHTHPIGHSNQPSGPDIWMRRIGFIVGAGVFPIAVYNSRTRRVSINYF